MYEIQIRRGAGERGFTFGDSPLFPNPSPEEKFFFVVNYMPGEGSSGENQYPSPKERVV